jgi:hypothetical protein
MKCKSCATTENGCYHTTEIGSVCEYCYRENQRIFTMKDIR